MLSPVYPFPADTGGKVRVLHIAQGLARQHQVTFAAPVASASHLEACERALGCDAILAPMASPRGISALRACLSARPYHAAMAEPKLVEEVHSLLQAQAFSLIYVHFLRALPYVPPGVHLPVVLDQHNVDREYWQRKANAPGRNGLVRAFAAWNEHKTVRYETEALPRIAAYVSVSERDRRATMSYARPHVGRFLVAPNAVDVGHYKPSRVRNPVAGDRVLTLGFLGTLDLALNIDAASLLCQKVLPRVRSLLPSYSVKLLLIGRNPPARLRHVAMTDPGIELTGTVEDVAPHLNRVDILALPLQEGAGTKLRTLEGMATGLPVVGFPLAFEGIDGVVDHLNARVVADPSAMSSAIADLARRAELRHQVGRKARELVEACYSWDRVTGRLASELATVVSQLTP